MNSPIDALTLFCIVYNLVLLAIEVRAMAWLRRKPTLGRAAVIGLGIALVHLAMVILAAVLSGSKFFAFRLLAYGLFLHLPLMLAGSGLLLWKTRPKTGIAFCLSAVLVAGVGIDAMLIEPTWLEVSHVRLVSTKVDRPIRIVVLADLQTDVCGDYEKTALQRVLAEKPDLILLAGDYLQVGGEARRDLMHATREHLKAIRFSAPGGAFAVRGNIDGEDWGEIFAGLPVTVVHQTRSFELQELRLTCLAVSDSFDPRLEIGNPDPDRFHLVLGHAPNFALGRVEADLLVCGHTHGGQVRLPFLGPVITLSAVPRSWAAGMTQLPGGGRLYVSRGIGMERGSSPRIRFLCRPELVVMDVVPE